MKGYHTKTVWGGIVSLFAFLCIVSCETVTSEFITDEEGNVVSRSDVSIQKSLIDIGVKGYAIDSLYTEFVFSEGKNPRILSFKKGIATFESNGKLKSVKFKSNVELKFKGSEMYYKHDNGLESEIVLNENFCIESVLNRYTDGRTHSMLSYSYYKESGYLNYIKLERVGEKLINIAFRYPDDKDGLTIQEGSKVYRISLAKDPVSKDKMENVGYVCNVFSHVKAPLTNEYVIIPDLYYLGLYGVPIKYLPDTFIQNGTVTENGVKKNVILEADNYKFFYK